MTGFILLSAEQMKAAENAAIEAGVTSAALMENAGSAAAEIAMRAWSQRPVAIVCGPGANGGDGFVVARKMQRAGWEVSVLLVGERAKLTGDAKLMADLYEGEIESFSPEKINNAGLIVDAIFGTGLNKPIEGAAKGIIDAININPAPVFSIDLPSGVDANNGQIKGAAIQATRTVTFHAKKRGHDLFPGRAVCGAVDIVDIGIKGEALAQIKIDSFENQPALWARQFVRPNWRTHKYHRGQVFCVSGGNAATGAARLSAMAALRIGAGLVTVLSPQAALADNAAHLTSIMLKEADNPETLSAVLSTLADYPAAVVIGPANGVSEATRDKTLALLRSKAAAIIDADAISSFAQAQAQLLENLREGDVLTPHEGEFVRLFPDIDRAHGRFEAARQASERAGAVIVLKGPDTIIAAPDGRVSVNVNAPPDLATAGAGDVLAGLIAGLRAQGMPGFEAACAGVWFHGSAGQLAGPGLIAEDLPKFIPAILKQLIQPPQTAPQTGTEPPGA